jgi:hypothetical protein
MVVEQALQPRRNAWKSLLDFRKKTFRVGRASVGELDGRNKECKSCKFLTKFNPVPRVSFQQSHEQIFKIFWRITRNATVKTKTELSELNY